MPAGGGASVAAASSSAGAPAAAAAAAAAASSSGSAPLLNALLQEMRALRGDILGAVDRRMGEMETTLTRAVDERVAAALEPLKARLDRLERVLGVGNVPLH
jgi:hypothetical protein